MDSTDNSLRIEVYIRAFVPEIARSQQEELLNRVTESHNAGHVDEVDVTHWSSQVCVDWTTGGEQPVGATVYRELQQAVAGTDLSIEPFFRERSRGDSETVVSLPVICLVLRRDDDIAGIYPCKTPEESHSVVDCLDAIERGDPVSNLREEVPIGPRPV